jgi:hypothetical protein
MQGRILSTVLKFATPRSLEPASGLINIFQTWNRIKRALETQTDVTFIISNPRAQGNNTTFNPLIMDTTLDQGLPEEQLQVVILVFPGLFKVSSGLRTCMAKARVHGIG